jgi:hypothetical protein
MEKEVFRKLTDEELDAGMKLYGERIENIERALELNIEYPSEKDRCELKIAFLKNKRGLFLNLNRKYLEYKLKKSINALPKKLSENSRKILEERLKKYKKRVSDFYTTKSFRDYEIK